MTIVSAGGAEHGTVSVEAGGTRLTYQPAHDYCGTDAFDYRLNGGSEAEVTVAVACVDDPPVAAPDAFTLSEDDDLAVLPVLANDTDVDGPALSVGEVTQPAHGKVWISGEGTVLEYTPDPGYCSGSGSPDTLTYAPAAGASTAVELDVECLVETTGAFSLDGAPDLFPAFDRGVDDYVIRCAEEPVKISATLEPGYSLSVDGSAPANGSIEEGVPLEAGQSFAFTVFHGAGSHTYQVRCLPSDFPTFSASVSGPREAEWYVVTPTLFASPAGTSDHYVAIFDNQGVPAWWFRTDGPHPPLDAKLLPDGNLAWLYYTGGGAEERRLDGTLVRTLDTTGSTADHHEILLLANGNYLMERYPEIPEVDMTACGGAASRTLLDSEIQELTPEGQLVWSWSAHDHIPFSEVPTPWRPQCNGNGDAYHLNSIEPDGDGYVLSFRHLDAVYRIDRESGAIDWKLGGVPRPESLTVVEDPLSATSEFGGQHDARILPDGTLTVFDDGTLQNRAPRSVRFSIDEVNGTATLIEQVQDAGTSASSCCGSTRRLPGGDWVTSWGSNPHVTEQTAEGARVFTLTFTQGFASYRASPISPGTITPEELREAMNVRFPR